MKLFGRLLTLCVTICVTVVVCCPIASAERPSVNAQCATVEAIFVHGSGQERMQGEWKSYDESIIKYLEKIGISHNLYELGTEHQYGGDGVGYKYNAVPVAGWMNGGYQNAAGAIISSGHNFDYGKSVEDGVKELAIYLSNRFGSKGTCHDSRIIIAGYS